jgi:hypothetical protein
MWDGWDGWWDEARPQATRAWQRFGNAQVRILRGTQIRAEIAVAITVLAVALGKAL